MRCVAGRWCRDLGIVGRAGCEEVRRRRPLRRDNSTCPYILGMDTDDVLLWLTLLFALLSAAVGGIGTQVYGHKQQAARVRLQAEREAERERNRRDREILASLQSLSPDHPLTAVAIVSARRALGDGGGDRGHHRVGGALAVREAGD